MCAVKKVGIALGGGGVRGFAHIAMLEVLDELGVVPHCITGTSMGAIVGARYAAGHSALTMRDSVASLVVNEKDERKISLSKFVKQMMDLADLRIGEGGLFRGEKFINALIEEMGHVTTFEQLKIPLKIVAADFWRREQVVFASGDLPMAVRASMSFPVVFTPVRYQERLLVDGGVVNPVPYDLLPDDCDITIAIDVMGVRSKSAESNPSLPETVSNVFQIAQRSIVAERMKHNPPDIYVQPEIKDIEEMEFHKMIEVYEQAVPAQAQLRDQLQDYLSRRRRRWFPF